MARRQVARITAGIALAIAVVAIVIVLFTGGSSYVIHAEFSDAGQLVNGDLVTADASRAGPAETGQRNPCECSRMEDEVGG